LHTCSLFSRCFYNSKHGSIKWHKTRNNEDAQTTNYMPTHIKKYPHRKDTCMNKIPLYYSRLVQNCKKIFTLWILLFITWKLLCIVWDDYNLITQKKGEITIQITFHNLQKLTQEITDSKRDTHKIYCFYSFSLKDPLIQQLLLYQMLLSMLIVVSLLIYSYKKLFLLWLIYSTPSLFKIHDNIKIL
jgi:hypothetical protein